MAGRLDQHWIECPSLQDNPLGDPDSRPLWVWTPPGYEAGGPWPVVYVLQSYTGQLDMWGNRKAFRPTYPEVVDALAPLCLVVFVDAWTSLGGSQFVDSPAVGNYHTYLVEDVVGFVDATYATLPAAEHRAATGHSSGGYGAMVTCLLRPDVFGAFGSHAGDCLFEACYRPGFYATARTIGRSYGGSFDAWWADVRQRGLLTHDSDFGPLMDWAMAACYSPTPEGGVDLPYDPSTGALVDEVWERWLAWDPVRMAATEQGAAALQSLVGMWIDAGTADEHFLDLGATAMRDAAIAAGAREDRLHYELFPGRHGGIDHRYPLALGWLAAKIAP